VHFLVHVLSSVDSQNFQTIDIHKTLMSVPSRRCGGGVAAEKCGEKTVGKGKKQKKWKLEGA